MENYTLVISGYGEKEQPTIGYYQLNGKGEIAAIHLEKGYENPSFLTQVGGHLVAIEEKSEGASVINLKRVNGTLEHLDTINVQGSVLCHITYVKRWSMILGACYGSGDVFALQIEKSGKLRLLSALTQEGGKDGESRAHCMLSSPDENYAYGVNIASNRILCYKLGEDGIIPNEAFPYLQIPQGEGPRHMKWHPKLEVAYLITEYSNRLFVLKAEKESGRLEIIQTIGLLKDMEVTSYGSTICINQKGTMLYAANRGMNTITRMEIQEDGTVVYVEETDAYGSWPRHIALTQDDKLLLIANQKSDTVSIVEVNLESGSLGSLMGEIAFPQASFVGEWEIG